MYRMRVYRGTADGMDIRRHIPQGRRRIQLTPKPTRIRPHAYLGRARRPLDDIYTSDHAEGRQSGRFRWLLSTCLAGAVGVLAILVVIAGSTENPNGEGGLLPNFPGLTDSSLPGIGLPTGRADGLRWAIPKADRLLIPSGVMATKFVVLDAVRQRRGHRDYIMNKPYARIVARLAPLAKGEANAVPQFNPLRLYADTTPVDENGRPEDSQQAAALKILDLLGGTLPSEDGQELDTPEVSELVLRAMASGDQQIVLRPGVAGDGAERLSPGELLAERSSRTVAESLPPFTSALQKTSFEEDTDDVDGREVRVRPQKGETLPKILARLGAEPWQARAMTEAARAAVQPDGSLNPGQDLVVTVMPSVKSQNRTEPVRFSIVEGQEHKLTVTRSGGGDFVASDVPLDERIGRTAIVDNDQPTASTLYASLHYTAERQGIPRDLIMQILKIHAYETDFRQRVRAGDGFEFFFDLKDEDKGIEGGIGELLATSITASGENHKFYRFRTPEGLDYYDQEGNTSRKFLMKRPVRVDDARITSGFGLRRHPVLQTARMHTGVDWACAQGTPILAAGNGTIEEAGRKGEYGNYVRIRHANGYKTAYGHMLRFGNGVAPGVKVRQGQIIGYVGSTGLSSGPHVHFEVLVNNEFMDPNTIQMARERQLTGKQLADFQKERVRIDALMRRNPVSTRVATVGGVQ
jgi:murein DD-endopeptidase MepM/ murein hydrolase activator NlpD